ncbi:hypothetical protein ACFVUN_05005 [Kitasatospora griseola]|uniref:hypothetical protein n=1 Tax=Kitasatospora griseola TaxID=2064 RepID=UPI0036D81062
MFTRTHHKGAGTVPLTMTDWYAQADQRRSPHPSYWHFSCALRRLGDPPSPEEVRALLTDVADRIPVLGHRLGGQGRNLRFEPVGDIDPRDHVEDVRFPVGWPPERCLAKALERPWRPGRPPWSLQVISGYRPGEHLLAYRVSHLLQDGVAAAATTAALLGGGRLPAPATEQDRFALPDLPAVRAGLRIAPRLLAPRVRWQPEPEPDPAEGAWLRPAVNLDRAPFDEITRVTGASNAQICLAVICGALRQWVPQRWDATARSLPVVLMMSLRGPRERDGLGNRVAVAPLSLPCADPRPGRRLRRIMAQAELEELVRYRRLVTGLLRLPGPVARPAARLAVRLSPPVIGVTIVSTPLDAAALGAEELLVAPARPTAASAGFVVLQQPSVVSFHPAFRTLPRGTDLLPGLLAGSLAELHAAVVPAPAAAVGAGG